MKESPQQEHLEAMLRSSQIVSGGFLGPDSRPLEEILEADLAVIDHLGYTLDQIGQRMEMLSEKAVENLERPVIVDERFEVTCADYKGPIVCPWPHRGRFPKRIITAKRLDNGETLSWTALGLHMIREHGFFEGIGSVFRIDPARLIAFLFRPGE
jgi:hypothetical protein